MTIYDFITKFILWSYNSEYGAHMYGWYALSWADEKGGAISVLAGRSKKADIIVGQPDSNWYVNVATMIVGILGI